MSFFNDAVSAAKTVGKSVGKRTEENIIISKKKLEAIELENKLSGLYEKLGKIYYLDFEGTADDLVDDTEDYTEVIDEIKIAISNIEELRTEIANLSKNK